jgi:hypothetical protein
MVPFGGAKGLRLVALMADTENWQLANGVSRSV